MTEAPATLARKAPDSAPIERAAAFVLRAGVGASVAVIALGLAVTLVRHPEHITDPATLSALTAPGAAFPASLADLGRELASFRGRAILVLGLLLLIVTPLFRVVVSVLAFAVERDWLYTAVTMLVLLTLAASFLVGGAV